ncbi:hypothetical protein [Roseimicrobium sp. ORNL1]|uniref:hypothetical protein n=1 Tax=Roseimicrobium sp. ORNL1 TaxID=2711231 RepID=UPI0013E0F70D|nr:hypothetical protein [Roseimicrobium sp. ORNL1]QIF05614.1 hypothetical protein G5S37_30315 [Roseimicrobium sp. ORNL1]
MIPARLCLLVCTASLAWTSTSTGQVPTTSPLPSLDNAEVRIPYSELRKLWETAHGVDAKEPPPGALLAADFRADVSTGKLKLEADFKVESFGKRWERIRLMGAGPAVAGVEPADARLLVEGDDLFLLTNTEGAASVKVRFVETALPSLGSGPFLDLQSAPSAMATLKVNGVAGKQLLKLGEQRVDAAPDGSMQLALPLKGGQSVLSLVDAASEPQPDPPPPPLQASEWTVQNEVLAVEGDGEIKHHARVRLLAVNGSALEATLVLPANVRGVTLSKAEDIRDWKVVRNADGGAELRLRWQTRDIMEREFHLTYALPQLPLATSWELRAPAVAGGNKTKSLFMFALQAGVEFSAPDMQSPVSPVRLSKWIAEECKAPEFGTVAGAAEVTVAAKLLPRVDTASAVITKSTCVTKLVADGSVLSETKVEIEHQQPERWVVKLPEKSTLLKCSVNNTPVNPIVRADGALEVPLASNGKSEVQLSYTEVKGKLDAVEGQSALELVQTPLFIHEVLWNVEIPEGYEAVGAEGNVEFATDTSASGNASTLSLIKKLCRNERPQIALFYRKRGLE